MPVKSNPTAATAKWVSSLSGASQRMKDGAMGVQKAPGVAAAAAADKWLARVTQAKDKYKARVGAVTLAQWQDAYVNVGIPRVAQGAQAKQGKYQAFLTDYLPYLDTGLKTIDAMPNVTLEDGIARATAMIRWNAKYVRKSS